VTPLPSDILKELTKGNDPVKDAETFVMWPMIQSRVWNFSNKDSFEIEPGEKDSLLAEFFIEKEIKDVQLYYFLSNATKKEKSVGWTMTKFFNTEKSDE
jgi:hypothetical protein